jgi:hypothetical protein
MDIHINMMKPIVEIGKTDVKDIHCSQTMTHLTNKINIKWCASLFE